MVAEQHATEEDRVSNLQEQFPKASKTELLRFCRARPNSVEEAADMYLDHLEWRKGPGDPQRLEVAAQQVPSGFLQRGGIARDGTPVIFVQGAKYDQSLEPEQYVLACAKALDDERGPTEEGKVTVLVDVRPGEGWTNLPAHKMLPFLKLVCALLPSNFPERAQRIVVYPVPMIVTHLWKMARSMLDPVTQQKFVILSGRASIGSPCPAELGKYVLLDQLPKEVHNAHQAIAQE